MNKKIVIDTQIATSDKNYLIYCYNQKVLCRAWNKIYAKLIN